MIDMKMAEVLRKKKESLDEIYKQLRDITEENHNAQTTDWYMLAALANEALGIKRGIHELSARLEVKTSIQGKVGAAQQA